MSTLPEELFTFLSGSGTSAASRIYPNAFPQGVTYPAVRYFKVSDPREHTHDGPSSLLYPKYQLDCAAKENDDHSNDPYLEALTLANEIIALMDGYKGAMGGVTVQAGFADDARDDYDPELGRHIVQVDFVLWHTSP